LYGLAGFEGDPASTGSDVCRDVVRRGVVSCANGSCSCESRGEVAMIGRDDRVSESLSTRDVIGRFVQARSETAQAREQKSESRSRLVSSMLW
jgi:hypothetical protein